MNATESTQRDAASSASEQELNPVWLRIADAVRTRGVGRSTLYELIGDGRIKTRLVKARRDSIRGIRLISADSLDAYIEGAGQ